MDNKQQSFFNTAEEFLIIYIFSWHFCVLLEHIYLFNIPNQVLISLLWNNKPQQGNDKETHGLQAALPSRPAVGGCPVIINTQNTDMHMPNPCSVGLAVSNPCCSLLCSTAAATKAWAPSLVVRNSPPSFPQSLFFCVLSISSQLSSYLLLLWTCFQCI